MVGESSRDPTGKPKSVQVFNCPSCGAGIILRAKGHSLVAACGSCQSIIDVTSDNYRILSEHKKKAHIDPVIPLGQRGKLHGVLFEVIGYVIRCDDSGLYSWDEYLLFNPYKGYRWLTAYNGHWNYVVMTKEVPLEVSSGYEYLGKKFKLFQKGHAKVTYVLGEFYWQVQVGEKVKVEDWVAPPQMLSYEKDGQESVWSVGEYVEPEIIRSSFHIEKAMPDRTGVAPNQPDAIEPETKTIYGYFLILSSLLLAIQMITSRKAVNQEVYQGGFHFQVGELEPVKNTPEFHLEGGLNNIKISTQTDAKETWMNLKLALIENSPVGKTYRFEREVGYYSGYDSDGYWSEGSALDEAILSSIPGGNYSLSMEVEGALDHPERNLSVSIVRGIPMRSNFWLAFFVISIFPALAFARRHWFESRRWSESDFNPYQLPSAEDD